LDPITVIIVLIDWAAFAACSAVIFISQRWFVGALLLWGGVIASTSLHQTAPGSAWIVLLGLPVFLLIAWMELVILSFIFPKRFYDRSPARRP
jgi:hypothetical protein